MINVGIVGYGYWGPNLARNFGEQGDAARVDMVCDLRPERLALAHTRYPTVRTTTSWQDLLLDNGLDAVAISTPVSTHFDLALTALQAGKHVLVEKPMTATVEQAERLIEAAARYKKVLMVDHTFVYTGAVRKMRELIDGGELGDIYYYDSTRVNLGLFQSDVNVLWDLAVHDLSMLHYLVSAQPCAVSATGMRHFADKPENIAYLTLFFDSPLIVHINVNWLAPVKVRRTLIGGSRKMIVYDELEPSEKVKIYDKGVSIDATAAKSYQVLVNYRMGDMWAPKLDAAEALGVETSHFIQCINTGAQPLTDGEAGLKVVRILEAASQSLANQGQLVHLTEK